VLGPIRHEDNDGRAGRETIQNIVRRIARQGDCSLASTIWLTIGKSTDVKQGLPVAIHESASSEINALSALGDHSYSRLAADSLTSVLVVICRRSCVLFCWQLPHASGRD
jgi:hypothetical protein